MFTVVKRFLRRINLVDLNILLYITIVIMAIYYREALTWAMRSLPKYFEGEIEGPRESSLSDKAEHYLGKNKKLKLAKELLDKSIQIDPNSKARYLLGEYYFLEEDYGSSLKELTEYIKIDSTNCDAYLKLALIYKKLGDQKQAISILRQGIHENHENVVKYKPHIDSRVKGKYNQKSQEVYEIYKNLVQALNKELILLGVESIPECCTRK
ncbi:MAG: hypothetical protein SCALA701_31430 [Candidatus Scalindua sp.]|nr:MAG: hypothetical protein SCALA701_31430 [Candidatus Scalindua sp.]